MAGAASILFFSKAVECVKYIGPRVVYFNKRRVRLDE